LEEQRENFRKRQEQEKQEIAKKNQQDSTPATAASSSSSGDAIIDQSNTQIITTIAPSQAQDDTLKNSQTDSPPAKKNIAPVIAQHQIQRQHASSPSIFTPTSVLRKMTAEKENDSVKIANRLDEAKKKPITGGAQQQNAIRNQPPPQPFMNNMSQMDARMKMQNDGGVFGMNSWDSPQQQQQQQQMQGMKPPGKLKSCEKH
jgi:hypothetical protein